MAAETAEEARAGITLKIGKLVLSSVRLSSAATLFGIQQMESALNGLQDGSGFNQPLEQLGSTVNSLTRCLVQEMAPGKQEALESMEQITNRMFRQSLSGLRAFDPRQVARMATQWAQRSSEAVAGWAGRSAAAADEPQLAAEVLGGC